MSNHDTAALDADQEERAADVVTGERDEPAELVLGRLEARMAESGADDLGGRAGLAAATTRYAAAVTHGVSRATLARAATTPKRRSR